jgi:hypothetical protein
LIEQHGGQNVPLLSYVIEVSHDSSTEEIGPITYGALEYLHIGLQGGTLYQYRMLAVNKYGRSLEWSETTAF